MRLENGLVAAATATLVGVLLMVAAWNYSAYLDHTRALGVDWSDAAIRASLASSEWWDRFGRGALLAVTVPGELVLLPLSVWACVRRPSWIAWVALAIALLVGGGLAVCFLLAAGAGGGGLIG